MSNPTVLLIDYEPASIEQLRDPLLAAGYNVEVVFDGVAGLQAFKDMRPDLVLIEAMIPKKHGFEVCQEIKKSPEGKNTPVVIATSIYKGRKYRNQALKNYGCDEYLEKPVTGEHLMEVCRRYLKEVEEQAIAEEAAAPEAPPVTRVQPQPVRTAEQGLNNLDTMNEKEISEKLDEILGSFGEAVDEVKGADAEEASPPEQESISDRDMVAELLDDVGSAEPVELVPEPEPVVAQAEQLNLNLEMEPETEPEPVETHQEIKAAERLVEPEPCAEPEAELIAQVDEVLPAVAFEAQTTEDILSAPVVSDESAQVKGSGARFLGLGIPAWIGIAAAVGVAVVGGVMYFSLSGDAGVTVPAETEVAVAETVTKPAPPIILETADPAAGTDPVPVQIDPAPAAAEPSRKLEATSGKSSVGAHPVPETKPPVASKVVASAVPTQTVKQETTPPAKPRDEPLVQAEPEQAEPVQTEPVLTADPEPMVVEPAVSDAAAEAKSDAESILEQEPVSVEPEVVFSEPASEPANEPVVPEPAQPVLAQRGELVSLNLVDIKPVQQVNVAPKYHPMARKLGQQGTVLLNLLIDENGAVVDVKLIREIPKSTLNQMAVKAVRQWVYAPARKDGVAVKVWQQVSLDFRL